MDPGGEYGWGRAAWTFLHGMTLDPTARRGEKEAQKKILELLKCVLPCPSCRESYTAFCNQSLSLCEPKHIGEYACQVHDRVNLKLDKPACEHPPEYWIAQQRHYFQQHGWHSYLEDMWYFLFVIAANYPTRFCLDTRISRKYREFFTTLPAALAHRPWGREMAEHMIKYPLDDAALSGRLALMQWLYSMYTAAANGKYMVLQPWDVIDRTMESIRRQ